MSRFVILGQARSGTTYLQTLLNSHPDVHCRGELFDPWQIDDAGKKTRDPDEIRARDRNPADFFERMMRGEGLPQIPRHIGVKILYQHNPRIFSEIIAGTPDLAILFVRRENRLAQFASMQQVQKSGRWTDTGTGQQPEAPRLTAHPFWATAECNRLENADFFLDRWLGSLPNPVLRLTYADLPLTRTQTAIAEFLSLATPRFLSLQRKLFSSPLRKQGQNRILDRFENAEDIGAHFTAIGKSAWLGPELTG